MIIRSKTFREWFAANLKEEARGIANHGADSGFPNITYYTDTVKLFDRFGDEIWAMAVDDANDMGNKNVAEMIAGFGGANSIGTLDQFKNLMVWYACEKLAREMHP